MSHKQMHSHKQKHIHKRHKQMHIHEPMHMIRAPHPQHTSKRHTPHICTSHELESRHPPPPPTAVAYTTHTIHTIHTIHTKSRARTRVITRASARASVMARASGKERRVRGKERRVRLPCPPLLSFRQCSIPLRLRPHQPLSIRCVWMCGWVGGCLWVCRVGVGV